MTYRRPLLKITPPSGSPHDVGYKRIFHVKGDNGASRNGSTQGAWWITNAQAYTHFQNGDKVYFHESDLTAGKWTNVSKKNNFSNNAAAVTFKGIGKFLDTGMTYVDGCFRSTPTYSTIENLRFNNDAYVTRVYGGAYTDIYITLSNSISTVRDCVISNMYNGAYDANEYSGNVYDGCIIYYNGCNEAGVRTHGHGVYTQGASYYANYTERPTKIKNCIIFSNGCYGVHGYVGSAIYGVECENTISFCTDSLWDTNAQKKSNFYIGGDSGTCYNPVLKNNCSYQYDVWNYPNKVGAAATVVDGTVTDNYFPDGLSTADGTYLENSGNTYAPPSPAANFIKVYDVRGRAHVAVYNWELLDSVTIDLSGVAGMYAGDTVEVINVQDLWVDRVNATVDANRCITVSMKAVDHSVEVPQGNDILTPATTFPEFGCFVVRQA